MHNKKETCERATLILSIITTIATVVSLWVFYGQLNEMRTEQRPWVALHSPVLLSPLVFDKTGVHLTIGYHLKNVGHSVAPHVDFDAMVTMMWFKHRAGQIIYNPASDQKTHDDALIPPVNIDSSTGADLAAVSKNSCDVMSTLRNVQHTINWLKIVKERALPESMALITDVGSAIFPDDDIEGSYRFYNEFKNVERPENAESYFPVLNVCVRYYNEMEFSPLAAPLAAILKLIGFKMIGAAHYNEVIGRTRYIYAIVGFDRKHPSEEFSLDPNIIQTPASNLRLRLMGRYAD